MKCMCSTLEKTSSEVFVISLDFSSRKRLLMNMCVYKPIGNIMSESNTALYLKRCYYGKNSFKTKTVLYLLPWTCM